MTFTSSIQRRHQDNVYTVDECPNSIAVLRFFSNLKAELRSFSIWCHRFHPCHSPAFIRPPFPNRLICVDSGIRFVVYFWEIGGLPHSCQRKGVGIGIDNSVVARDNRGCSTNDRCAGRVRGTRSI